MDFDIRIKRRFWFGYQKFIAENYKTEILGNTARLAMVLKDGCRIAIPRIDRRLVKVYPIFRPTENQVPQQME